ncbi:imidazolonepropionase [Chloroflexus sp.]|uniref:imidazolonepropionase n=1 Tax=Chloroflexus sp. TaxID=1904827 RepID=UPI00260FC10E|nr:imidazolonepropionase [uncultured Chloroflexus sp.]
MEPCDLLIHSAAQVVTCAGPPGPRRGAALRELAMITNGAVAIRDTTIIAVGASDELRRRFHPIHEIDARGRALCPGLIDCHTHIVYAGDRVAEFEQRCAGATYQEIMAAGGGILRTMQLTRSATTMKLVAETLPRLRQMLQLGTTTAEVKTGYGLERDAELRQLAAIALLSGAQPIELVPTFLPAHAVPPEFSGRASEYIDLVVTEMLPLAHEWYRKSSFAARDIPLFVDVFCERGAFDVAQSRRVLTAARDFGLPRKAHVDEFVALGGLEMALELGATSVDHLDVTAAPAFATLANSSTIAVLLPLVSLNLGLIHFAAARQMIDAGVAVALSTDANPGSAPSVSLPLTMAIACRYMGMLPAEALIATTVNAAHAIGLGGRVGSLMPGMQADLLVLTTGDYRWLMYELGGMPVEQVIKRGRVVWDKPNG